MNLESSARTHYDALLVGVERRLSQGLGVRASYTLAKASNYANDDQIPFSNGPVDSHRTCALEFGPTPNHQRHRFTLAASWDAPAGFAPLDDLDVGVGRADGYPVPSAGLRIPELQRNAGGRLFTDGRRAQRVPARSQQPRGGVGGVPMPLVSEGRAVQRPLRQRSTCASPGRSTLRGNVRIEPMLEIFNVFNVTNTSGISRTC